MNVPLVPIPVTSIPFARIPWVPTHARVMPGTQEMENLAMVYYIIIQAKHVHTNHEYFFLPGFVQTLSGFKNMRFNSM